MIVGLIALTAIAGAPQEPPKDAPQETVTVVPARQGQPAKRVSTVADALRELKASSPNGWTPPASKPDSFPAPPEPSTQPGSWVQTSDYPSISLRNEEQGITRFTVTVSEYGRVEDCQVTSSSGHQALDDATCSLIEQHARFRPAFDKDGNRVEGTYSSMINWVIPPSEPPPPMEFSYGFTVETDGSVSDCRVVKATGEIANHIAQVSPCSSMGHFGPYFDHDGRPVRKRVTITMKTEVSDAPGDESNSDPAKIPVMAPPHRLPSSQAQVKMFIEDDGTVSSCEWVGDDHPDIDPWKICNTNPWANQTDNRGMLVRGEVTLLVPKDHVEDATGADSK